MKQTTNTRKTAARNGTCFVARNEFFMAVAPGEQTNGVDISASLQPVLFLPSFREAGAGNDRSIFDRSERSRLPDRTQN